MSRSSLQKVIAYLGACLIAMAFIGLGMWQWNRAQESRLPVLVDVNLVALDAITHPRISLPEPATLRRVLVTGSYVMDFEAPNQVDAQGKRQDWEVGLLRTESGAGMLVVRGFWSERIPHPANPAESVTVVGKLMPHQSDDYALAGRGVLQRLDSSVIVGLTSLDLYDGYVIAESEKIGGSEINRARIVPPVPRNAVPGFYWQHLSYVVIWWFMALVVLYLPFYQRRVTPSKSESEEIREEA